MPANYVMYAPPVVPVIPANHALTHPVNTTFPRQLSHHPVSLVPSLQGKAVEMDAEEVEEGEVVEEVT